MVLQFLLIHYLYFRSILHVVIAFYTSRKEVSVPKVFQSTIARKEKFIISKIQFPSHKKNTCYKQWDRDAAIRNENLLEILS